MALYLGDYAEVLDHVRADLIFTSPPYNLHSVSGSIKDIKGRIWGKNGRVSHESRSYGGVRDYPDNLPEQEYQDSQITFLEWCSDHLLDGGTVVYNHKPRRRSKRIIHPVEWIIRQDKLVITDEIVWDRTSSVNNGVGQIHNQTERMYVMRKSSDMSWKMNNRRERGLTYQSDLWRIPYVRGNAMAGHCAPFPLKLAGGVIRLFSEPGQLVCDPYMGSGTTGIVAISLGRKFEGAEIMPEYYDISAREMNDVRPVPEWF